jgi:ABC-type transport system involved in multi-copper enzyme maturation permease subunit
MSTMFVIAQLTLERLFRGRAVWVSVPIAGLPVLLAIAMSTQKTSTVVYDVLAFEMLLLAVLPPMFVASSIGDDIEDRTATYLWSRPVPRWSVLAGKLVALAPLSAAFVAASWILAVVIGDHVMPSALSIVALASGAIVVCCVSAALATLVPKHGMPLSIAYMLFFDLPVGFMPVSLSNLSITHQLRAVSRILPEVQDQVTGGAIGLVALGAVWLALAVWRIRRLES